MWLDAKSFKELDLAFDDAEQSQLWLSQCCHYVFAILTLKGGHFNSCSRVPKTAITFQFLHYAITFYYNKFDISDYLYIRSIAQINWWLSSIITVRVIYVCQIFPNYIVHFHLILTICNLFVTILYLQPLKSLILGNFKTFSKVTYFKKLNLICFSIFIYFYLWYLNNYILSL